MFAGLLYDDTVLLNCNQLANATVLKQPGATIDDDISRNSLKQGLKRTVGKTLRLNVSRRVSTWMHEH